MRICHLPTVFSRQALAADEIGLRNLQVETLEQLATWLGFRGDIRRLNQVLADRRLIPIQTHPVPEELQWVMRTLSRERGWPVLREYTITPMNSLASLIHWRPLSELSALLTETNRSRFWHYTDSNFQMEGYMDLRAEPADDQEPSLVPVSEVSAVQEPSPSFVPAPVEPEPTAVVSYSEELVWGQGSRSVVFFSEEIGWSQEPTPGVSYSEEYIEVVEPTSVVATICEPPYAEVAEPTSVVAAICESPSDSAGDEPMDQGQGKRKRTASGENLDHPRRVRFADEPEPSRFLDSHSHLDRMCQQLFGGAMDTRIGAAAVLAQDPGPTPRVPAILDGGVMVFCDPPTWPVYVTPTDRWVTAVGIHPKLVRDYTDERQKTLRRLLANPAVKAIGEFGLDHTVCSSQWGRQTEVFEELLELATVKRPIVLHLRGAGHTDYGIYDTALTMVEERCGRIQPIHLHCFSGTPDHSRRWMQSFTKVYFGFTALVKKFTSIQLDGVRAIPLDRILLETDSPYLPPREDLYVNTPNYIGEVAELVAGIRGISVEELAVATYDNTRRLYQF